MTATPADVLRARTGIASDIVMADGTTVEGVLLADPDAGDELVRTGVIEYVRK